MELNVELVQSIQWNDEAFASLVLPSGRKNLLQSLVEAHDSDIGFDDFVQGKGHGLVINLYGPPGVGKTLSAEATSEHVKKPLYVIGGGDLGTTAMELDNNLQDAFDIATAWKAIVLIDEVSIALFGFCLAKCLPNLRRLMSFWNNVLCTNWIVTLWLPSSSDMWNTTVVFYS